MASMFRVVTKVGASAPTVIARLRPIPGFASRTLTYLSNYFAAINGGVHSGRVTLATTAVQATGTVTLSSMVATDTITINGTAFTAVASGATGNQFNVGASDTITATNAAAAINASATKQVSYVVTVASSAAIITITSQVPGYIGNMNTLAISAHGSVSGANLTSGSEDANTIMYNGQ